MGGTTQTISQACGQVCGIWGNPTFREGKGEVDWHEHLTYPHHETPVRGSMRAADLSASELWDLASAAVRKEINVGTWQSTFSNVEASELEFDVLTLRVPNAIVREKLDGRYRSLLEEAVTEAAGRTVAIDFEQSTPTLFDVDLLVDPGPADTIDLARADKASDRDRLEVVFPEPPDTATPPYDPVRRYDFESFVIGASNRFAHAAALSVAERPGGSYNPLFIYGDAGLGKTHLLRAVEAYVNNVYPRLTVRYVSTESFLNEFVDSIKNSQGTDFKRHYRNVDVLLVDDIQFIAGKDGLQEEFFHTFNELYGADRQIVLSSDRPPDAIPTLEERLRSRFVMGLLTDIQPPDIETRIAILRKKAERDGYFLPNEVSEFIADNITTNIRELEGALNKVTAFANLHQHPMTRELAERTLRDFIDDRQPRPITVEMILGVTSEQFHFTIDDLKGKSRRRPLVLARQMAMFVSRELTELSYPAIAREFGGRDHTTVMHACDKISALMAERTQIYDDVTALEKVVRNKAKNA